MHFWVAISLPACICDDVDFLIGHGKVENFWQPIHVLIIVLSIMKVFHSKYNRAVKQKEGHFLKNGPLSCSKVSYSSMLFPCTLQGFLPSICRKSLNRCNVVP